MGYVGAKRGGSARNWLSCLSLWCFISHIHEDARISAALEDLIKESLLGGVEVFNTSNRVSLAPGEPWRDLIIQNLRGCVAALVVATPQSVSSPWINFESGGAWISEKRGIPVARAE